MLIRLIIILVITFGVTMLGELIFIDSDSVYGITSKTTVKGGVYRMDKMDSTSPTFNATFYMMKLNGSETHTHTVSNFKLIGSPVTNNNSTTFNGTATLTMKNGPVNNVPISISLMSGHAVSIWIDPLKIDNHFGNTPIYGSQHLNCVEKPQYCK